MFKNAGGKLTAIAKVIFVIMAVIDILSSIAGGIGVGKSVNGFLGFIVFLILAVISVVSAWLSTILLYAFGELCVNVNAIREGMGYQAPEPEQIDFSKVKQSSFAQTLSSVAQGQPQQAQGWACPNCGKHNAAGSQFCTGCGYQKN